MLGFSDQMLLTFSALYQSTKCYIMPLQNNCYIVLQLPYTTTILLIANKQPFSKFINTTYKVSHWKQNGVIQNQEVLGQWIWMCSKNTQKKSTENFRCFSLSFSLTITEFWQLFGHRKQSATMSAKKVSRARKSGPRAKDLVLQAVAASQERKGLSSAALLKILAGQGYDVDKNKARVKTAISTLVKNGALVRTTGVGASACFRMTSKPPAARGKRAAAKRRAGKKSRRRPKKAKATGTKRRAGKKPRRRPKKAKARKAKKRTAAKKTSKRRRKAPKRRRRVVRKASGTKRASAKKAARRRRRAAPKRK